MSLAVRSAPNSNPAIISETAIKVRISLIPLSRLLGTLTAISSLRSICFTDSFLDFLPPFERSLTFSCLSGQFGRY